MIRSTDSSSPARFPSKSRRLGSAPCCNSRRMTSASGASFRTASIRGLYAPKSCPLRPLTGRPTDSKKRTEERPLCPEQAACRALERLASAVRPPPAPPADAGGPSRPPVAPRTERLNRRPHCVCSHRHRDGSGFPPQQDFCSPGRPSSGHCPPAETTYYSHQGHYAAENG